MSRTCHAEPESQKQPPELPRRLRQHDESQPTSNCLETQKPHSFKAGGPTGPPASFESRPNALLHDLSVPTSHCVAVSSSLMEKIHV